MDDVTTPEFIAKCREEQTKDGAEQHPVRADLEDAWRLLSTWYGEYDGRPLVDRVRCGELGAIHGFVYTLDGGIYPPPEVLQAIALGFSRYMDAGGQLSLDESFFGRPHKVRDSYAYQRAMRHRFVWFHMELRLAYGNADREGRRRPSREQVAEEHLGSWFAGDNTGMDVASFLRAYDRWRDRRKEAQSADKS
jgi:hypothetical protein